MRTDHTTIRQARGMCGKLLVVFIVLHSIANICCGETAEPPKPTILGNDRVRAEFRARDGRIHQQYFAARSGGWELIAESFLPPSPFPAAGEQLFDSAPDASKRILVSESLQEIGDVGAESITLRGKVGSVTVEQKVSLVPDADRFHIEVTAQLDEAQPILDYLLLPLTFAASTAPDFTHAPGFKPNKNCVIGDGAFHSPAVIVQAQENFLAIVPDVEYIREHTVIAPESRKHPDANSFPVPVDTATTSLPMILDLELQSGITDHPLLAYGAADYLIHQHVYWDRKSETGSFEKRLSRSKVGFACELFLRADAPVQRGFQEVSKYHWANSGHKRFNQPRPQSMPLAEYAECCYPAHINYQGYEVPTVKEVKQRVLANRPDLNSWQQWQLDGQPVGGFRIVAPQWYDLIYNIAWFNNACDATGLYYWGQLLDQPDWVDKAERIVNFSLAAPQKDGIFPTIYNVRDQRWINSLWHPPAEKYDPNETIRTWDWENDGAYMPASTSTTAGFLLLYREMCEDDPRILPYVTRYAQFLVDHMQPNGVVPSWFDKDLRPLPSMREFNADGGVHVWVLAELYKSDKNPKYLATARQMAEFLIQEVLPKQRWSDFEAFYSCAPKAENYFDPHTGQPVRDLMSVYWAISGFCSLYEITGDKRYLDAAEAAADYAGLYQAVWAPDFLVHCYPFGGFAAQLGDGEWMDQRTHRFAAPLVRLGRLSGRTDLMERGIAASRSSLALMTHPRHEANEVHRFSPFPIGIGPENAIHEGYPQTPLATAASWGTVGGLASAAQISALLGGVYIDLDQQQFVGVDGVNVLGASLNGDKVELQIENVLASLPMPYERAYPIQLRIHGLKPDQEYELLVNGKSVSRETGKSLADFRWTLEPGRSE